MFFSLSSLVVEYICPKLAYTLQNKRFRPLLYIYTVSTTYYFYTDNGEFVVPTLFFTFLSENCDRVHSHFV